MTARTKGRKQARTRPVRRSSAASEAAAPEVEQVPESPATVAARVLALHRWNKAYGKCAGQLALSLLLFTGEPLTEDPEEEE